jgi:hypothetical protein
MSKGEAEMLLRHARRQEAVVIEHIKSASARKAEFEARVATIFDSQDAEWRDIVNEAKRAVALANAHIADVCKRRGFPESWAPEIQIGWLRRTETAMSERRGELRRVAYARFDEWERAAIVVAKARRVEYEGAVLAGHLESAEALLQLAALPDVAVLIPAIDPVELQRTLPIAGPSGY